jgi:hypothetical protein
MYLDPLELFGFIENLTDPEVTKLTEVIDYITEIKNAVIIHCDGQILLTSQFASKILHDISINDFTHSRFFLEQDKEIKEKILNKMFSLDENSYYINLKIDDLSVRFKFTPKVFHFRDRTYRIAFCLPETENQQRSAEKAEINISNRYRQDRFDV